MGQGAVKVAEKISRDLLQLDVNVGFWRVHCRLHAARGRVCVSSVVVGECVAQDVFLTELEIPGTKVNVMLEKRVQGVMVDNCSVNNPVQRFISTNLN